MFIKVSCVIKKKKKVLLLKYTRIFARANKNAK